MRRLELTLSAAPAGALDLSPLQPATLADLPLDRVRRLKLRHGTRTVAVGDLFAVAGETGGALALRGITPGCFGIARGMDGGLIEIAGHGGQELAREMRGGEIRLRGDAGDGLALGLRGGLVRVKGDAGARLGGAVPGSVHGMNGGTVIVDGAIGERGAERLRRGLVIVGGATGPYLADRMVAGTVIVFGEVGDHVGLGMRRGTLLLGASPQELPSTFNLCGVFELTFVTVLARHVAEFDRAYARRLNAFGTVQRWCGDMAHGGRGEILLAQA